MENVGISIPAGAAAPLRERVLARPVVSIVLGVVILLLDLLTGRFLMFPILFIAPVTLSGWYGHRRLSYFFAVLLPLGRLAIATWVESPSPVEFAVANAGVRIVVLVFVAFLVARIARLTEELQKRVDTLVTVCAWSRTVEYQGEWLSFEDYLRRRFNLRITHGISPNEAERALAELRQDRP